MDVHLPFELRALESALATAVSLLELEARMVERKTEPALRSLMQQVHYLAQDLVISSPNFCPHQHYSVELDSLPKCH